MSIADKLIHIYFDLVYNRVYDSATGKLQCYRELQQRCINKIDLRDSDRILCVGVGTGNEIVNIWERNANVKIVGVDYSDTALRKLREKAAKLDKEIETRVMDARCLKFSTGSFDKVVCIHVMDFVQEVREITSEIIRVSKDGGQFVITYPSKIEGAKLGANIIKDSFHRNVCSGNPIAGFIKFIIQVVLGTAYLPLVIRRKKSYTKREVQEMFSSLISGDLQMEDYPTYQDYIVYGRK
jgi:ubiquinone/menaquinone biosynthesis C-methylase UbiE